MSETRPNGEASPIIGGFVAPSAPDFTALVAQGNMQRVLSQNLGKFVVCEFFMDGGGKETRAGILEFVGANSLVLYDDADQNYLVCDAAPLRFVTFSTPEQQPAEEPPQSGLSEPQTAQENGLTPMAPINGVQAVGSLNQVKAAFNYTKRKSRR